MNVMKHLKTLLAALARGDYTLTEEGLILAGSIRARGTYRAFIDGELAGVHHNLVPTQGLTYFLSAGLGNGTRHASWYLAIFSGAATPAASWTAANFTANSSEITSATEGYSEATRPAWTPAAASAGLITNAASLAAYSVVATTSIEITGAGLLSDSAKGGTTGTLASASRFASSHVVNNGSTFELGYEVELTDS